jgi:two-component system, OmpR family, sensor histidine kinase QseC
MRNEDGHDFSAQERAERDFIANAAHELQSPLAGIISAVEVLQAGAKDTEERDRFLGHIEREARRLERVTRALLVLARTQALLEPPRSEVLLLRPLLDDLVADLRPSTGVVIELSCPDDLAAVVNADLTEQALRGVIGNAVKYTEHGRIEIVAEAVSERALEVRVRDTGPGIPLEVQPRVFDRFVRAGGADDPGFGLGLAIAKQAAEVLGGGLELHSEPGAGTLVTLHLPLVARMVAS